MPYMKPHQNCHVLLLHNITTFNRCGIFDYVLFLCIFAIGLEMLSFTYYAVALEQRWKYPSAQVFSGRNCHGMMYIITQNFIINLQNLMEYFRFDCQHFGYFGWMNR